MDESSATLAKFRELMDKPTGQPGIPQRACLCGKMLKESDFTVKRHSGVVNFTECLCADCREGYASYTRVVCLKCKALMSMLPPQRVATGFEFKPKSCVHVEKCYGCTPGLTSVPCLEHIRFCRDQGIPTNADKDIVQEAEQKALQGKQEADRMRAELQDKFPAP